jgi:putative alpha-1,2-mannosidase
LFDRATIQLDGGKQFTVKTIHNGPDNIYIQHIELNGREYKNSYIQYSDIRKGGEMKITMGEKPNYNYGRTEE